MSNYILIIEKRKSQKAFVTKAECPKDAIYNVLKEFCPDKFEDFVLQTRNQRANYINCIFRELTGYEISYIGEMKSTIFQKMEKNNELLKSQRKYHKKITTAAKN